MGIADNRRLMAKVCEMYYLGDVPQKEIAARLRISRPQVSRLISRARSEGMVEIRIRNPHGNDTALERRLTEKYPLEDALVVSLEQADSWEDRNRRFAREAAAFTETMLQGGMRLGVMSGRTVSLLAQELKHSGKPLRRVVPLAGGIGTGSTDLHANAIAAAITRACGGESLVLNAPLVASSPEAAAVFRQEPGIAEVLEQGRHCDLYLIGIGNVDEQSTTVRTGGISPEDLAALQKDGAVCSVCNSYYNEEGREVGSLAAKSIGLGLRELKQGRVAACAMGRSKTEAIRAALRTGKIHLLMTDAETAAALL